MGSGFRGAWRPAEVFSPIRLAIHGYWRCEGVQKEAGGRPWLEKPPDVVSSVAALVRHAVERLDWERREVVSRISLGISERSGLRGKLPLPAGSLTALDAAKTPGRLWLGSGWNAA